MIKITITENEENQRLDRFLKKYFRNAPLSHIYKLIRKT
jgi:23S rRNA pseudouridine955/2504/2580 synthase